MGKYNLTDILNEYIGGGRVGTLKISYRDLVDKMDELEKSGKVIIREIPGPSGDGKTNREFEVVDRDSAVPGGKKQERGFTVYDYKFGFDPGSEEHFMEEYPFSVGGNDLKLAMELIDGVKPIGFQVDINEDEFDKARQTAIESSQEAAGIKENMYIDDDEFEMEMGRSKKDSLKKEMMIHVDQLIDGNIDMNDFMNVVEDVMAEVNSLKEEDAIEDEPVTEDKMMDAAAKMIKDRILQDVPMDIIMDFVKTHMQDIKGMSNSEIKDEFEEFRSVNYDYIDEDLKEHFKRFK